MIIKSILSSAILIIISFSFYPVSSNAQLINGSFELNDSTPSLMGWTTSCSADSFYDAPSDGGKWCIKLEVGNVKGCYPAFAWQLLPWVRSGDICELSFCFKNDSLYPSQVEFSVAKINMGLPDENITFNLTSNPSWDWRCFSFSDTIQFSPSDTIALLLNAGATGGPLGGFAYFDKINLVKTGDLTSTPVYPEAKGKFNIKYDYFSNEFIAIVKDFETSDAELIIYSVTGKEVIKQSFSTYNNEELKISIDVGNLSRGIYVATLHHRNNVMTRKIILIKQN